MKYGGVASEPAQMDRYVELLGAMGASTVRVSMFLGRAFNRRFDNAALDRLLDTGLTEMIIQSSEAPDVARSEHELAETGLIQYVGDHPHTLFIYELGNEPDKQPEYMSDPQTARTRILTILRDVRPHFRQHTNLLWAVNMPSKDAQKPLNEGGTGNPSYSLDFVRDTGDGLGPIIPGPHTGDGVIDQGNVPALVTAHCYGFTSLCGDDGNDPNHVLDLIRSWNKEINVKVTEAGINDGDLASSGERGKLYVDYGQTILPNCYGNVDSLTFYALAGVTDFPVYNLTDAEVEFIGQRQAAGACGGCS